MASERMRILIRKFEPSCIEIASRCLAAKACPEMPQTVFKKDLRSAPDCSQSHFWRSLRSFITVLRCPRLLPEPFWETPTVSASLGPPGPAQVLECPSMQPERF